MIEQLLILKGTILHTLTPKTFTVIRSGYIIAKNGIITYCGEKLPGEYQKAAVTDYGDRLIIPGFVDIHAHAPQFCNRGLGMDKELLPWLETYTFPEESKFSDPLYAADVYRHVVNELWRHGTTRSVLFGTIHNESTLLLMRLLADAGLGAYVGKVNMDRNAPAYLQETTEESIKETLRWIEESSGLSSHVKPIITPRFVPTCTPRLMTELGRIAKEYNIPVQSHLCENHGEIAWVRELHPEADNYADVYLRYGLLGETPTVMAHCIHLTDDEIALLDRTKTTVAHCPYSNNNLSSGIAPVRKLLDAGISIGLASDISGGHRLSMANVLTEAIQLSKMKWVEVDKTHKPLTLPEAFYLATRGGGRFFGNVGTFERDFACDALVIDDSTIFDANRRTPSERLERWLYIGDDRQITARYVNGRLLPEPHI